jgi:hypothetical protein
MIPIFSLLLVVTLSILITRVATIALIHTGLSRESARFQARSAFTGAGFTTNESEQVVNHPVRRRIVMFLMLLGNAGFVTVLSSLVLTFVGEGEPGSLVYKLLLLGAGLFFLTVLGMSAWVDRHLSNLIDSALKRYTNLDVRDYASLIHLTGEYRLVELQVNPNDWLADKTLAQARLREEGIVVLGIKRLDGSYLGTPKGPEKIHSGDILILYGRVSALEDLDQRRRDEGGEQAHQEAIEEQAGVRRKEAQQQEKVS